MKLSNYISNYFSVKKYNDDYYKLTFIKHYEYKREEFFKEDLSSSKYDRDHQLDVSDIEENLSLEVGKLTNNLSRAKGKVFEYAMCNDFDYFITLTLNREYHNASDLSLYIKKLGQFIRNYRSKFNVNIQYILIPEKHKDGNWHMHGLIRGIPDSHFHINKNGYLDWAAYSDRFGYCSLSKVQNNVAVSKYITKYISKSFNEGGGVTERNKKLYYNSRGLEKATKVIEGQFDSNVLEKIKFDFENKYVSLKDLDKAQFIHFVQSIESNI